MVPNYRQPRHQVQLNLVIQKWQRTFNAEKHFPTANTIERIVTHYILSSGIL